MIWENEYPVWVGADRRLSESTRRHPSKVQVMGHERVDKPEVDDSRIRLNTSGGSGALTGCPREEQSTKARLDRELGDQS
jgi:serine/threonine protein phosphatase 1